MLASRMCYVLSCFSHVQPQTVAHQVPPSMGFSRQEYWSGLPFPSPPFCLYSYIILHDKTKGFFFND